MKNILASLLICAALPASAIEFGDITIQDGGRGADGRQWIGVDFDLNAGWKTYWQYSGQNGLSPYFDFSGSENIGQIEYFWPEPHLIGEEGVEAAGYKESFQLPIAITPVDPSKPIRIELAAQFGVCEAVCIPVPLEISRDLNSGYSLTGVGLQNAAKNAFDENATCTNENEQALRLSILEGDRALLHSRAETGATRIFRVSEDGTCLES